MKEILNIQFMSLTRFIWILFIIGLNIGCSPKQETPVKNLNNEETQPKIKNSTSPWVKNLNIPDGFPTEHLIDTIQLTNGSQEVCLHSIAQRIFTIKCTKEEKQEFILKLNGFTKTYKLKQGFTWNDVSQALENIISERKVRLPDNSVISSPLCKYNLSTREEQNISFVHKQVKYQFSLLPKDLYNPDKVFQACRLNESNKCTEHMRWIQFPEGLYKVLKKNSDRISLITQTGQICLHKSFRQENKIFFSQCGYAPIGERINFKLKINGIQDSHFFPMKRGYHLKHFKKLNLKTETIDIILQTEKVYTDFSVEVNKITPNSKFELTRTDLCTESIKLNFNKIINKKINFSSSGSCSVVKVNYPSEWGDAKVLKMKAEKIKTTDRQETVRKTQSIYQLPKSSNFSLTWGENQAISSTPIQSEEKEIEITQLKVNPPSDKHKILSSSSNDKPYYKITNKEICASENRCSSIKNDPNNAYVFNWREEHLPQKIKLLLKQQTNNQCYRPEYTTVLTIGKDLILPPLVHLKLKSYDNAEPISLEFPADKSIEWKKKFTEGQVFIYKSPKDCNSNNSVKTNVKYPAKNIKYSYCEEKKYWARIESKNKQTETNCAEGLLKKNGKKYLTFSFSKLKSLNNLH